MNPELAVMLFEIRKDINQINREIDALRFQRSQANNEDTEYPEGSAVHLLTLDWSCVKSKECNPFSVVQEIISKGQVDEDGDLLIQGRGHINHNFIAKTKDELKQKLRDLIERL